MVTQEEITAAFAQVNTKIDEVNQTVNVVGEQVTQESAEVQSVVAALREQINSGEVNLTELSALADRLDATKATLDTVKTDIGNIYVEQVPTNNETETPVETPVEEDAELIETETPDASEAETGELDLPVSETDTDTVFDN